MTDRRTEFLEELRDLLTRHKVFFTAADNFTGNDWGEDIQITADFEWEVGDDDVPEEINFGTLINTEIIEKFLREG